MGWWSRFGELLMWLVFLFSISCFLFFFWFWLILYCFTEAFLKAKFSSTAFVEVWLEEKLLGTLENHFWITQSHSVFLGNSPICLFWFFFFSPFLHFLSGNGEEKLLE